MVIAFRTRLVAAAMLLAGNASAADLFNVTATIGGSDSGSRSYTTAEQVLNSIGDDDLRLLAPSYAGFEQAVVSINYRGMQALASYELRATELQLEIPVLGISETFAGGTRAESRRLLRAYLRDSDTVGRIMRLLAATSPADPIAGNPASLQSHLVMERYRRDFSSLASELSARGLGWPSDAAGGASAVRPKISRISREGITSVTVGLPFSHAFDTSPQRPLSIDGELVRVDTEGTVTYGAQLGLAYRVQLNPDWYLVPGASIGVTGSRDLQTTGSMVSGSLTSALRLIDRADYALWMGNALNWTRTLPAPIGEYRADPHLRNWVLTNGLLLSLAPGSLMRDRWVEVSLSDSRYHGSDLYDRRHNEIGVAMVLARRSAFAGTTMKFELSLIDSTHSRGWGARFHLMF